MFNIFEIFELFCGELIQKNILATPKNVKQSIVLLTFGIFFQHQTFLVYKWIVHENQQLFLHCLRFTFLLHANEIRYFVGLSENCFFLVDLYGFGYFGIWLHNRRMLQRWMRLYRLQFPLPVSACESHFTRYLIWEREISIELSILAKSNILQSMTFAIETSLWNTSFFRATNTKECVMRLNATIFRLQCWM